ncbi:RNA exonuclease 1 homolog isoform X1 [Tribolium madens]|uniref:RNA exonuclease 1 homolog isoform X1 n=2 Tax=Tribolium madens TaxID=41895 RepID=UPI001CF75AF0|nr:RNA exonuclease 1 homolog isoform X1 [Tribolium madens]
MEKIVAGFLSSPTVLVAIFFGGSVLLLFYILKLFKIEHDEQHQNEPVSGPKRDPVAKSKKKPTWNRSDKPQNFTNPWLLKTLKSHTGQVLNIDYSASGKYLASCAEEDPPEMNPDSNKENLPVESSPRSKGLSRRQRKNRRPNSPDAKKKFKTEPLRQCLKFNISERAFADLLHPHLLTYEQLFVMGYPVHSPSHNNSVVFFNYSHFRPPRFDVNAREFVPNGGGYDSHSSSDSSESESSGSEPDYDPSKDQGIERTCVRCGRGFFTTNKEYLTQERCNYHWGKLHTVDALATYSCCKGKPGSVGCATCKLHVWSGVVSGINGPCEGFVKTRQKKSIPSDGNYGVYALDCEMCYTVAGLEVTKVTVVAMDGRLVYDTYVKPKNEIVDYNTRFSGITAKDLKPSATKTLKEVQNDMRGFISADSILIGHGLENDLRALKLVHKTVVDTAWSFPHYNGLPYKRSLRSLVSTFLKREIQSGPHNSYEDACACMELMLYKVRKENKGYKIM